MGLGFGRPRGEPATGPHPGGCPRAGARGHQRLRPDGRQGIEGDELERVAQQRHEHHVRAGELESRHRVTPSPPVGRASCQAQLEVAAAPGTHRAAHGARHLATIPGHRAWRLAARERIDGHQPLVGTVAGGVEVEHAPGEPSSGVEGPAASLAGRRRDEQRIEELEAGERLQRLHVVGVLADETRQRGARRGEVGVHQAPQGAHLHRRARREPVRERGGAIRVPVRRMVWIQDREGEQGDLGELGVGLREGAVEPDRLRQRVAGLAVLRAVEVLQAAQVGAVRVQGVRRGALQVRCRLLQPGRVQERGRDVRVHTADVVRGPAGERRAGHQSLGDEVVGAGADLQAITHDDHFAGHAGPPAGLGRDKAQVREIHHAAGLQPVPAQRGIQPLVRNDGHLGPLPEGVGQHRRRRLNQPLLLGEARQVAKREDQERPRAIPFGRRGGGRGGEAGERPCAGRRRPVGALSSDGPHQQPRQQHSCRGTAAGGRHTVWCYT